MKLPEETVLSHSDIILRHVCVGDEAYPLTIYLMKPEEHQTEVKEFVIRDCRVYDVL